MKEAEDERRKAAMKVEQAKEKTRRMKMPVGLAKPLTVRCAHLSTLQISQYNSSFSNKLGFNELLKNF